MNYGVTLFVSRFGFIMGSLFIVLVTAAGFMSKTPGAGFAAFLISFALMVPFLMFCEGMHALVTIALNTRKGDKDSILNQKGA